MSDSVTLSVVDFLRLAEERRVARVDLADIGRSGALYVRELTAAEKQTVLPRPKGQVNIRKDQSMTIDWSQLSPEAASKFLKTCLVVGKNGKDLAGYFGSNGESVDTAVIAADELSLMYDSIVAEIGKTGPKGAIEAMERLEAMPNAIVDLCVKRIRAISGLDDEDDDETADEKKG